MTANTKSRPAARRHTRERYARQRLVEADSNTIAKETLSSQSRECRAAWRA